MALHIGRLLIPVLWENALSHSIPWQPYLHPPSHSLPSPTQFHPSPSPLTVGRANPKDVDGPVAEGHNQVPAVYHGGHPGLFQTMIGCQEVSKQ